MRNSLYLFIPLLPFMAFLILGLFGSWIRDRAHVVAVPAVLASFIFSLFVFGEVAKGKNIIIPLYTWLNSGNLEIELGLYFDPLTCAMILLVTTVSSLVHIYTIGYMRGEPGYARFFAYIALFTFSMLMLVLATNFLQLFVFWEAVGLCSYLLIGHWYDRPSACSAATKAFIVNRVGDFGFILGVLFIFIYFGSLDYNYVFMHAEELSGKLLNILGPIGGTLEVSILTLMCLLLFVGAIGKSAQFPLHVWLPDAMEGPTPISALIHAATMVTAGVFMIARLSPLYALSPAALEVVAMTGGITMILGATIALTQYDIKRIVAYSTVSQLGYMVMACGLGAYTAGMYHLLTHGAFKALLFLACGSVIIALHHEQDMRYMGGLKDKLPLTYWTFLIGSLTLAGFPFTAGWYSKDALLVEAWLASDLGKGLAVLGLVTALLTAFYSFRLIFVAFWGESRVDPKHAHHIHEPSTTMTAPLVILAALSIIAGFFGIPEWLAPVLSGTSHDDHHSGSVATNMMVAATGMGLLGIALAYFLYVKAPSLPDRLARHWQTFYDLSFNKWYVDEAYEKTVVQPTFSVAHRMWEKIDTRMIDGTVNGIARGISQGGAWLRRLQTGQTQHYALAMTAGAVLILTVYIFL